MKPTQLQRLLNDHFLKGQDCSISYTAFVFLYFCQYLKSILLCPRKLQKLPPGNLQEHDGLGGCILTANATHFKHDVHTVTVLEGLSEWHHSSVGSSHVLFSPFLDECSLTCVDWQEDWDDVLWIQCLVEEDWSVRGKWKQMVELNQPNCHSKLMLNDFCRTFSIAQIPTSLKCWMRLNSRGRWRCQVLINLFFKPLFSHASY